MFIRRGSNKVKLSKRIEEKGNLRKRRRDWRGATREKAGKDVGRKYNLLVQKGGRRLMRQMMKLEGCKTPGPLNSDKTLSNSARANF